MLRIVLDEDDRTSGIADASDTFIRGTLRYRRILLTEIAAGIQRNLRRSGSPGARTSHSALSSPRRSWPDRTGRSRRIWRAEAERTAGRGLVRVQGPSIEVRNSARSAGGISYPSIQQNAARQPSGGGRNWNRGVLGRQLSRAWPSLTAAAQRRARARV